jgi:dipeptidyl aminopeptidase/acylaminoacyl peptidase
MGDFPSKIAHNAPDSPESKLIGAPIQESKEKSRSASPLHHVSPDDAPTFIAHGDNDELVPLDQSIQFEAALKKAGVDVQLLVMKNQGHGLRGDDLSKAMREFIEKQLLPKE